MSQKDQPEQPDRDLGVAVEAARPEVEEPKLYKVVAPPSDRYIRDWGANRHGPFQVADRRHSGRFQT